MGSQEENTIMREQLSPRSRSLIQKTERSLELHISEQKMEAARQLKRMQKKQDPLTVSYRLIRRLFQVAVDIFYHYTEVVGADNVPPPGNAAIMCPNHGNSLTDAVVCVSQTPRMVRLTAKDTLFTKPFFGWFVRNVGTVPLQRRDEHEKVDNKAAVNHLNDELLKGAMVCLFPEGRSRFHWGVDDIKAGVASIAYNVLSEAKKQGRLDFTLCLCPAGLNYLHREKFRSGLVVEFAPPLILSPESDVMKLEKADAVEQINKEVQEMMRMSSFHAEDWSQIRNAHTARNIFAPLGTHVSLAEYVELTKYWCNALAVNDPRDKNLQDSLATYQDKLDEVGLKDERVSRPIDSRLYLLWCIALRVFQLSVLGPIALLGAVLWSPTFMACRVAEKHVMKRKKKPTHVDEVAQYKMLVGTLGFPLTSVIVSIVAAGFTSSMINSVWILPVAVMFMWISIRLIEDAIAGLRALRSLVNLLRLDRSVHQELVTTRKGLWERLEKRAKLCGGLKPPEKPVKARGFWFEFINKFDPRRRRKKDWNEVLRLKDIMPVDYNALRRQRSMSQMSQDSSEKKNQ